MSDNANPNDTATMVAPSPLAAHGDDESMGSRLRG